MYLLQDKVEQFVLSLQSNVIRVSYNFNFMLYKNCNLIPYNVLIPYKGDSLKLHNYASLRYFHEYIFKNK